MAYPVDLNLTGTELLLGLVNYDNGLNLQPNQVVMVRDPEPEPPESMRNTRTIIVTKDPEFDDDYDVVDVEVIYNRIDLNILFSIVECSVLQTNIDVVDGVPVVNNKILEEISRRYNMTAEAQDFIVTIDSEQRLWLSAKDTSLSYRGSREIRIISSLASRVTMPVLNGFFVVVIDNQAVLVPVEAYPVGSLYHTREDIIDPNEKFGGTWVKRQTINLTGEQLGYYHQPLGAVIELIGESVPDCDHYEYIVLGDDSAYNNGKCEIVNLAGGEQGVKVTLATSPYKDMIFELVPSIQGSKAYMLISKNSGKITYAESEEYIWARES